LHYFGDELQKSAALSQAAPSRPPTPGAGLLHRFGVPEVYFYFSPAGYL